jgi:hypothetical protein
MLSTSLDELSDGHESGSSVEAPESRGPLGPPREVHRRAIKSQARPTGPDAGNVWAAGAPADIYKDVEYFTHCVGHWQ